MLRLMHRWKRLLPPLGHGADHLADLASLPASLGAGPGGVDLGSIVP